MADLTCPACRARKTTGHVYGDGCLLLSPKQLVMRFNDHQRYLLACERERLNPYYDTLEEWRGDK